MTKTKTDQHAPSFEESLKRLETIVGQLQDGELSLEESINRYEEGIKLAHSLSKRLEQAQKKVEQLMESGGELTTKPFADALGDA